MRLLVIDSIPTPYNTSFHAALAVHAGIVSRTIFLASRHTNRSWNVNLQNLAFDHRILPGLHAYIEAVEVPLYFHWGLWSEMRSFKPDVVAICGYGYFATLEVLWFARLHRLAAVLWSGGHLLSGFFKRALVERYKRWVITQFDAYLTYGSAARDQLVHYNAPSERIVVGCNTVDVHWFSGRADALRRVRSSEGPLRLLYVGRFVPIKNVAALIAAVGHLRQRGLDVTLILAGDGALRPALEAQANHGAQGVTFVGFREGDELVEAYVNADALVLPSLNEPWGLVVNEAAACGIPSVVSTRAGAARDLIVEGETGLTFDPAVAGDLERALESLVRDRELCRRMGEAAHRFILTRDQAHYASRLVAAAESGLAARPYGVRPLTPTDSNEQ